MKPEMIQTLNGYDFIYGNIVVSCCRLHQHLDGRVTGEISIFNRDGDTRTPVYPPSQFNFSSDRTRTTFANSLKTKLDSHNIKWADAIDQVCYVVQAKVREGEPVQSLSTETEVPPLKYLLKPLLIEGVPTVIFGEKGVTKSTLALVAYACLTIPWPTNPLCWEPPEQPTKCLYLDYELPSQIAHRNIQALQRGMGLPHFTLHHRRCTQPLATDLEQVANHVANVGAKAVIIDSLARACGGELNKTEQPNAFFEALDKLNVTSLILAQTSKDVESKHKTIYGNALFTYYARSIFELCRSDFTNKDIVDGTLFHRWANLTRKEPEMGMRFTFNQDEQGITVEQISVSLDVFVRKLDTQQAILHVLEQAGPLSAESLSEKLDVSDAAAKSALSRLKNKGLVENTDTLWYLVEDSKE